MAGQQQQIIDTIFGMKRKLLRRDDSDTEDAADSPFRQDLKRKTRYARASDPDFLSDPRPYKKRVEHAGYHRSILQRNPTRFDPDGDIVEHEDEYEDEDDLEAVEENPYGDIHLENLLAPLTSAADLATHPSMSVVYTSKHLTNLANEAGTLSRKEQVTISRAKGLLTKLQGDSTFAPAALAAMNNAPFQEPWANGTNSESQQASYNGIQNTTGSDTDVNMEDAGQSNGAPQDNGTNGRGPVTNGTSHNVDTEQAHENGDSPAGDDASDATSRTAHRMTTRARAHATSTPSPPLSPSSDVNLVHPLFTFSIDSLPDCDFGLPANEAEDARIALMAYVQKQEEVARITSDLYQGMLQADRMRQDVFKWAKAEAHVGEMSDGEDWYDAEEWSLDQSLVKGRDEEEDETALPGKKSTRQRRKPDKDDRYLNSKLRLLTSPSHVFCTNCADVTGLSRSSNAHRTCPACNASLQNNDDVVVADLMPSEDYKTSVLSGLSPTIIMECASRGLAFHSYQTSQEIIYQEHLAKGLSEKYTTLSQQMDHLIHDANSQIKLLQDRMQAMQAEQTTLEANNHELSDAFQKKARAHQQAQNLYQTLKAQVMASHVANAAGDEAEMTIQTARGDRFIDRVPGARTGSANFNLMGVGNQQSRRQHNRAGSGSSGSSGQQRGGVGLGPMYASQLQGRGLGSRAHTGQSAPLGTPSQGQSRSSRLPTLGGTRQNAFRNPDIGPPYQASPITRQPLGGNASRNMGAFALGGKTSRRSGGMANAGPLGR
ncbi:hypothetical protein P153DRAFT_286395 [Dothidotthia symphoricarpi CBS 119687]|uniref:Transcriptional regulatory protein RXT2 N-terminal domain-containing protein n=1 Tax=Dothidotthia symphoricarpi CBS 119687 TaxID=1392245 RepID=A0A6A6AIU8_9PLEO|nr:uncharacterized protein P153DRAFT_286395 [Dothidotthia symphoricarpi CBS 119687]KAF2131486.1 hypothetical protein P153DRAFT_286395 [Dothidotthia symphoricarpi CBS 119687]